MNNDKNKQYEAFSREILVSERLRATLLAIVAAFLLISFLLVTFFFHTQLVSILYNLTPFYFSIAILGLLIIRELVMRFFFTKQLKEGKVINETWRYGNMFAEISIPTILLIVFSYHFNSIFILSSPIILLYFVFIILSTLSLDFKISLFGGIVGALEYLGICMYVIFYQKPEPLIEIMSQPYIYIGKAVIIFASGLTAGFVGSQLKKRIYSSFDTLEERNRAINLFGQQVSQEIVDELISNGTELESKRKFVCIMFLDIRGFTSFAEKREPEEIISYQNDVFGFMIEIITKNHGIINQFLGDGYMATFGAPISKGNDCQNSVNAALEIINEVNRKSNSGEIHPTRIGIGLHAGYVVAGNVGTSIRKQYSISGNTVILASRIEQLNKEFDSQLLISQEVLDHVKLKKNVHAESKGFVPVKGREEAIHIYKLA